MEILVAVLLDIFKMVVQTLVAAGVDVQTEMDAVLKEVADTKVAEVAAELKEQTDFAKREVDKD